MSNFAKVQLEQIWQKTLQLINESAHFDDAVFNAWYKEDSHLFDIEDDFATIVVPYKINKQIMMDSIDLIQQKLSDVLDMKVSCQILLKSEVDMLQPSSVVKRRNEILFEDKVKKSIPSTALSWGKTTGKLMQRHSLYAIIPENSTIRCSSLVIQVWEKPTFCMPSATMSRQTDRRKRFYTSTVRILSHC